jgi:putative DNA primase/helicase
MTAIAMPETEKAEAHAGKPEAPGMMPPGSICSHPTWELLRTPPRRSAYSTGRWRQSALRSSSSTSDLPMVRFSRLKRRTEGIGVPLHRDTSSGVTTAANCSGLAAIMVDLHTLAAARGYPIERVIIERGIKLRGRVEQVGPCPHCGGRDRFAINTRKRVWNCRGCRDGGDVIALVQKLDNCDFREAVATLTGERLSGDIERPKYQPEKDDPQLGANDYERQQRDAARWLWRASKPTTGTMVELYLPSRGIDLPLPKTVRFLPANRPGHHPAMLVPYGLPKEPEPGLLDIAEDAITAVQLTFLRPDGTDKADIKPNKITIGSPAGMPMVLAPMNDLLGLAICEGIEDALTAHQVSGLGAWASGGAAFMPKLGAAVADHVEAITICAHDDKAGQRYARALADALDARGFEIYADGLLS